MKKIILMGLMFLLLPMVFAVSINDTIVQSLGLNTNITFNETRYYDSLVVGSTGIKFTGYRGTSSAVEKLTFNITGSDLDLYVNSTQEDLPYIVSSEKYSISIYSGSVTDLMNVSAYYFALNCNPSGDEVYGDFSSVSCNTCDVVATCVSDDLMSFEVTDMASAQNNVLSISYYALEADRTNVCDTYFSILLEIISAVGWMVKLGIVLLIASLFYLIVSGYKDKNLDNFGERFIKLFQYLGLYAALFAGLAILIGVSSVIMGVLCSVI